MGTGKTAGLSFEGGDQVIRCSNGNEYCCRRNFCLGQHLVLTWTGTVEGSRLKVEQQRRDEFVEAATKTNKDQIDPTKKSPQCVLPHPGVKALSFVLCWIGSMVREAVRIFGTMISAAKRIAQSE